MNLRGISGKMNMKEILNKIGTNEKDFKTFTLNKKINLIGGVIDSVEFYKESKAKFEVLSQKTIMCHDYLKALEQAPKYVGYDKETKSEYYFKTLKRNTETQMKKSKSDINKWASILEETYLELDFLFSLDNIYFSVKELCFIQDILKGCSLKTESYNQAEDLLKSKEYIDELLEIKF